MLHSGHIPSFPADNSASLCPERSGLNLSPHIPAAPLPRLSKPQRRPTFIIHLRPPNLNPSLDSTPSFNLTYPGLDSRPAVVRTLLEDHTYVRTFDSSCRLRDNGSTRHTLRYLLANIVLLLMQLIHPRADHYSLRDLWSVNS
ncbi:hypothetical protein A0H81_09939 [Grifola frondosa]|uniref:Uncharacterized protein n=1 Tax=Grifola frondosa TaxID=5627 RepID=A0A1C7LZ65_GRIFR|nr:hypothetical protein A0H81_09939 [Grifola frondosa]